MGAERGGATGSCRGDIADSRVVPRARASGDRYRAAPGGARLGAALDRGSARDQRGERRRLPQHAGRGARRRGASASSTPRRARPTATTRRCPRSRTRSAGRCRRTRSPSSSNELYADVFARCYGMQSIGLRYFNVFGARQDPEGAYAAVIPRWIRAMLHGEPVVINGDGETSRDFCYVDNVVQANLLAATHRRPGRRSTRSTTWPSTTHVAQPRCSSCCAMRSRAGVPAISPTRRRCTTISGPGDVRHSQADIGKARRLLGYAPTHRLADGIRAAMPWYLAPLRHRAGARGSSVAGST